ncbi:hypothetical protein EJB05_24379, partial [Eragrostis curvula]
MKPSNGMDAASNTNNDDDADCISSSGKVSEGPVDLPLDITEKILCCISPLESARFATVCKSWAAAVSERLATPLVPHLFVTEAVPLRPDDSDGDFHLRGYVLSVPLDRSARLTSPAIIPAPKNLRHRYNPRSPLALVPSNTPAAAAAAGPTDLLPGDEHTIPHRFAGRVICCTERGGGDAVQDLEQKGVARSGITTTSAFGFDSPSCRGSTKETERDRVAQDRTICDFSFRSAGAERSSSAPRPALSTSRKVIFINPVTDAYKTVNGVGVPRFTRLAAGSGDTVLSSDDEFTHHERFTMRLYCRAQGSEEWSRRVVSNGFRYHCTGISSLVNCRGVVYVLYWDGHTAKIDTNAGPPLLIEEHFSRPWTMTWRSENDHDPLRFKDYLVESDGEVLLVRQRLAWKATTCSSYCHCPCEATGFFEVYKLDEIGRRWAKVETLDGDRALFVSTRSSFSVRASQTAGCWSNCIYFVSEGQYCGTCHENSMSTWGVYSMVQGKVLFEHTIEAREGRTVARWFRPSLGFT